MQPFHAIDAHSLCNRTLSIVWFDRRQIHSNTQDLAKLQSIRSVKCYQFYVFADPSINAVLYKYSCIQTTKIVIFERNSFLHSPQTFITSIIYKLLYLYQHQGLVVWWNECLEDWWIGGSVDRW